MAGALEEKQVSWVPNRKPVAGIIASSLVAFGVWAAKAFGQVDVPADIAAGMAGVIAFVVAYLVPEP